MNELFLVLVVFLLVGMVVMMFKYARYIHSLPKTEGKADDAEPPGIAGQEKQDKDQ